MEETLANIYYGMTGERIEMPTGGKLKACELVTKGASLDNLGLHEEAIDCYLQSIELSPNFAEANANLGRVCHNHNLNRGLGRPLGVQDTAGVVQRGCK